jgi:HlyD family secretion protein
VLTTVRLRPSLPQGRGPLIAGIAAILLGAVFAAWLLRAPRVVVVEVTRRDLAPAVHGVGTVEAKIVVLVASKIAGRIAAIHVDQGDRVEPGQVLVLIDDAELSAEVQRSAATVRAVEAQRSDVEAGARAEEIAEAQANVERARAQLDDLVAGARGPEIEELREKLRGAQATRILAEREFHRAQSLFARELVAAQDVDRARQAYAVADAQERAAVQALSLGVQGSRPHQITSARAQLVAAEARVDLLLAGPRPRQLDQVRAQLEESRAALRVAQERQASARIGSPLGGYVVSRELEAGSAVNPGTPILKIADPASGWVTVHVDERESGLLRLGDAAVITLRSAPAEPRAGRVARIRRESDRVTEQLAVDVVFDVPPARLTLGEQVDATLRPARRHGVTVAPAGAIFRTPAGTGAWVVQEGRLRFRRVRAGIIDAEGWLEIVEGLTAGEWIVDTPGRLADLSHEGRRVSVRPWTGEAAARTVR